MNHAVHLFKRNQEEILRYPPLRYLEMQEIFIFTKSHLHFPRNFVCTLSCSREKIKGYCYEYRVEAI